MKPLCPNRTRAAWDSAARLRLGDHVRGLPRGIRLVISATLNKVLRDERMRRKRRAVDSQNARGATAHLRPLCRFAGALRLSCASTVCSQGAWRASEQLDLEVPPLGAISIRLTWLKCGTPIEDSVLLALCVSVPLAVQMVNQQVDRGADVPWSVYIYAL